MQHWHPPLKTCARKNYTGERRLLAHRPRVLTHPRCSRARPNSRRRGAPPAASGSRGSSGKATEVHRTRTSHSHRDAARRGRHLLPAASTTPGTSRRRVAGRAASSASHLRHAMLSSYTSAGPPGCPGSCRTASSAPRLLPSHGRHIGSARQGPEFYSLQLRTASWALRPLMDGWSDLLNAMRPVGASPRRAHLWIMSQVVGATGHSVNRLAFRAHRSRRDPPSSPTPAHRDADGSLPTHAAPGHGEGCPGRAERPTRHPAR